MENDDNYIYEYIYYYPNLNQKDAIIHQGEIKSYKEAFLPNTIDMTKYFKKYNIPEKAWPCLGKNNYDNYNKINIAISELITIIDNLFITNTINSWNDLAILLNEYNNIYTNNKGIERIRKKL